jgi:hypothetical protein
MLASLMMAALAGAATNAAPDSVGCPAGEQFTMARTYAPIAPKGDSPPPAQAARKQTPDRFRDLPPISAVCDGDLILARTNVVILDSAPGVPIGPSQAAVPIRVSRGFSLTSVAKLFQDIASPHVVPAGYGAPVSTLTRGSPCLDAKNDPASVAFWVAGMNDGRDVTIAPQPVVLAVCAAEPGAIAQVFVDGQLQNSQTLSAGNTPIEVLPAGMSKKALVEVSLSRPGGNKVTARILVNPAAKAPDPASALCTLAAARSAGGDHRDDLAAWLALQSAATQGEKLDPYAATAAAARLCAASSE